MLKRAWPSEGATEADLLLEAELKDLCAKKAKEIEGVWQCLGLYCVVVALPFHLASVSYSDTKMLTVQETDSEASIARIPRGYQCDCNLA
jgi:hypothetical protein